MSNELAKGKIDDLIKWLHLLRDGEMGDAITRASIQSNVQTDTLEETVLQLDIRVRITQDMLEYFKSLKGFSIKYDPYRSKNEWNDTFSFRFDSMTLDKPFHLY